MNLLSAISISIVAAAALALIARRFRQPLILGYIVSGALLGPHIGLGVITDETSIELISEIGLILLLFIIGLEISLPRLLQAGRSITVSGLLQVPICAGLAWLALGGVAATAGGAFDRLYLAVAMSMSSTLIVVKLLSDKFELGTFGGRVTLGILVFQDLWAIVFISLQPNLQNLQPVLLVRSLAAGLGLLAAAALLARFVLPGLFRFMATSPELMLVSSMAWCFLVAGVAAWAGLSAAMGALIAGVVIASFPYSVEVVSRVSGVRDFFITLFFVALGLKIPEPSLPLLLMALGGAAFVVLSRFAAMYPIFALLGLDTRTAGVVAINLGQISEFSLVIFSLGVGLGHVSRTAASLVLYTLLITSVLSTYGILFNHALASWLAGLMERIGLPRWLGRTAAQQQEQSSGGQDRARDLFLLGVSREGLALIEHLDRNAPAMKHRIVAVDFNPETLQCLQRHGVEHYYGDIATAETLRHAGIERAAIVISGISDWFLKGTSNLQLLYEVRGLTRSAKVVLTADTLETAKQLYAAGADYVLIPQALTAEHLFRILCESSPNALRKARELQTSELFRRS
jgi:Kef-type K+ transport system membrane component KefB